MYPDLTAFFGLWKGSGPAPSWYPQRSHHHWSEFWQPDLHTDKKSLEPVSGCKGDYYTANKAGRVRQPVLAESGDGGGMLVGGIFPQLHNKQEKIGVSGSEK